MDACIRIVVSQLSVRLVEKLGVLFVRESPTISRREIGTFAVRVRHLWTNPPRAEMACYL